MPYLQNWTVDKLSAEQRQQLKETLQSLLLERYSIANLASIDQVIFRQKLTVIYDDNNTAVGFLSTGIKKITIDNTTQGIIDFGMHVRPGVRNLGKHLFWVPFKEMLRFKWSNPWLPLCYVGAVATPVAYDRAVTAWPTVYPKRDKITPRHVTALVRAIGQLRGYTFLDDSGWLIDLPIKSVLKDPARLQAYMVQQKSDAADYYRQCNPGYVQGDLMMMYVAADLGKIVMHLCKNAFKKVYRNILKSFESRKRQHDV